MSVTKFKPPDSCTSNENGPECRICLAQLGVDERVYNLFDTWCPPWDGMESTIAEDLNLLTNIQVNKEDILSNTICRSCKERLQNACDFVKFAQKNDLMLKRANSLQPESEFMWPKPIELEKNIEGHILENSMVMEIDIKQEVDSEEDEYSISGMEGGSTDLNAEIKVEPEEMVLPDITPAVQINGSVPSSSKRMKLAAKDDRFDVKEKKIGDTVFNSEDLISLRCNKNETSSHENRFEICQHCNKNKTCLHENIFDSESGSIEVATECESDESEVESTSETEVEVNSESDETEISSDEAYQLKMELKNPISNRFQKNEKNRFESLLSKDMRSVYLNWKTVSQPYCAHDYAFLEDKDTNRTFFKYSENISQYFLYFLTPEIMSLLTNETNLNAKRSQKSALELTATEMAKFIGIIIYMSVVQLQDAKQYWTMPEKLKMLNNVMPFDRFQDVQKYLSFSHEKDLPKCHPDYDKYQKARPLLKKVRERLRLLPKKEHLIIDEDIIPMKYTDKEKLIKAVVLRDRFGITYDLEIEMEDLCDDSALLEWDDDLILRLLQSVPENKNHKLYLNKGPTFETMALLYKKGILTLRVGTDVRYKFEGSSSIIEDTCLVNDVKIFVVAFNDKRVKYYASTFVGRYPEETVLRVKKNKENYVKTPCPKAHELYHLHAKTLNFDAHHGDSRIKANSSMWYKNLFYYLIDMVCVNTWILWSNDHNSSLPLINFKLLLAESLQRSSDVYGDTILNLSRQGPEEEKDSDPQNMQNIETQTIEIGQGPKNISDIIKNNNKKRFKEHKIIYYFDKSGNNDRTSYHENTLYRLSWEDKIFTNSGLKLFWGDDELPDSRKHLSTPLQFWLDMFTPQILCKIKQATNLNSILINGKYICVTTQELEKIIGFLYIMSVIRLPNTKMYWTLPLISNAMKYRRFEEIMKYLYFFSADASLSEHDDRYKEIKPLLNDLKARLQLLPKDEHLIIDEQHVSTETRGPKHTGDTTTTFVVLRNDSGLTYDIEMECKNSNVVLKLAETIPEKKSHKLYFTNRFSNLVMMVNLHNRGILPVCTISLSQVNLPLDYKINGKRGVSIERVATVVDRDICVVSWFEKDNRIINFASTYVGKYPETIIKRLDKEKQEFVHVPCPQIIAIYNKYVNKIDMLRSMLNKCRIEMIGGHLLWYHQMFFHLLDLVCVNSWILYRKVHQSEITLIDFKLKLAQSLISDNSNSHEPYQSELIVLEDDESCEIVVKDVAESFENRPTSETIAKVIEDDSNTLTDEIVIMDDSDSYKYEEVNRYESGSSNNETETKDDSNYTDIEILDDTLFTGEFHC